MDPAGLSNQSRRSVAGSNFGGGGGGNKNDIKESGENSTDCTIG